MQAFRDLKVWQRAHALALASYKATRVFPASERYGLVAQIRRASASVGANIAEGCSRQSRPELARFLEIASGSAGELENHFLLARDLGILADADYQSLDNEVTQVKRMLTGLRRAVKRGR
jgi:four helix bundle protein